MVIDENELQLASCVLRVLFVIEQQLAQP